MLGGRRENGRFDHLADHCLNDRLDVIAVENLPALLVYDRALRVHDVVVFQHVFTDLEVAAFNFLLRLLDGVGQDLLVDRRILVESRESIIPMMRSEPNSRIMSSVIAMKNRDSRGRPDGRTGAELIVDPARFVPLGTQDVKAAGLLDFFRLGRRHLFMLLHAFGVKAARLKDLLVVRVGETGRLDDDLVGNFIFLQVVDRHILGIAAEHNISAAPGHVRGDRHRTEFAGLRDDFGFFFVIFSV